MSRALNVVAVLVLFAAFGTLAYARSFHRDYTPLEP